MLRSDSIRRSRIALWFAIALLVLAATGLAWMQFQWLGSASRDEQAVQRAALESAAARFDARLGQALRDPIGQGMDSPHRMPEAHGEERIDARVRWSPGESFGALWNHGQWQPTGTAQTQQLLGRGLLDAADELEFGVAGLWLDPPAWVVCREQCEAIVFRAATLAEVMGELADQAFASYDHALWVAVHLVDPAGRSRARLYPLTSSTSRSESGTSSASVVNDLTRTLLTDSGLLGPDGFQWQLRVNHGGERLNRVLGRTWVGGVLLGLFALLLIGIAMWLIYASAARRQQLAEQQLYFAASASHELRTPLAVIGSAADNLASGTIEDADRVREYGGLIRAEVRKLSALVDNVLQFSRSSARGVAPEPVAIQELIDEAVAHSEAALRGMEVRIDIEQSLDSVPADRRALLALLGNLLGNAGKYAEGEKWVAISARAVNASRGRRALAISVRNPVRSRLESDPEHWFEPFARGRAALKRGIPGTGLGLAVAQAIALQHGGGLSVSVVHQREIRFTVFLPLGGEGA